MHFCHLYQRCMRFCWFENGINHLELQGNGIGYGKTWFVMTTLIYCRLGIVEVVYNDAHAIFTAIEDFRVVFFILFIN